MNDFFDLIGLAFDMGLSDIKNHFFRAIDHFFGIAIRLQAGLNNLRCGLDQLPKKCFFFNNAGVMFDIGGRRHHGGQLGEITDAAETVKLLAFPEFFGDRNEIHGLVMVKKAGHHIKNLLVPEIVEKIRLKNFDGFRQRQLIKKHRPQNAHFGFAILGRDFFVKIYRCLRFSHKNTSSEVYDTGRTLLKKLQTLDTLLIYAIDLQ